RKMTDPTQLTCNACGMRFDLTPDYLAQYGGQDTTCSCGNVLTIPAAAAAGPLTHIPGLFYLIALNVIVAHEPRLPGGLLAVLIYDAIWFALPIAALATCIVNPDTARDVVVRVERWTAQHSRTLLLTTSFVVGVALVIRGALLLAGVTAS
ncbi:MAG TPA: hypothetical protein VNC79_00065, partial [Mycobacteriales bacterium]|nr:hypothetical protein [Mycobacteriales bacterium]